MTRLTSVIMTTIACTMLASCHTKPATAAHPQSDIVDQGSQNDPPPVVIAPPTAGQGATPTLSGSAVPPPSMPPFTGPVLTNGGVAGDTNGGEQQAVARPQQADRQPSGNQQADTSSDGVASGQVCAAAIGMVMRRDASDITVVSNGDTPQVGLQREDGTDFAYECSANGNHVIWREVNDGSTGPWHDENQITYTANARGMAMTADGRTQTFAQ